MPTRNHTFDPVWEQTYASGHSVRYPWDAIVTHVFRNAPKDKPRKEIHILELGCGTAPNLLFAAKEGFTVYGLDGSASAIAFAKQTFEQNGLQGQLLVGDFTGTLPFESDSMDMVLDRGAVTCVGFSSAHRAIKEAHRVLRPGGTLFLNPYSDISSSAASGCLGRDGLITGITEGGLENNGQLCFWGRNDILRAFAEDWTLLDLTHVRVDNVLKPQISVRGDWRIVARKC